MKYYGYIGFLSTEDTGDGVWTPRIKRKLYSGDILRMARNKDSGEHINDGLRITTMVSLYIDPWFEENLSQIRYIEYMNAKWDVSYVDIQYPRINITLGGLYHGDEPEEDKESQTAEDSGIDSGE